MLHQQKQTSASSDVIYLAFRTAFITTLEILFDEFKDPGTVVSQKGFLERLPLMAGCAPQVQLECLVETWKKMESGSFDGFTEIDQCVCYCAAAELAQLGTVEDTRRIEQAIAGPRTLGRVDCLWLASKLRTMQITWPFEQDCVVTLRDGNFLDVDLDAFPSALLQFSTASRMLELTGRWHIQPSLLNNTEGLVREDERGKLSGFFQHHAGLMNL
jgi:hypothetical protein